MHYPLHYAHLLLIAFTVLLTAERTPADTLDEVRQRGQLRWGGDSEGGGPYVYPDPDDPRRVTGFEVELAQLLANELGVRAEFCQGTWSDLPALLGAGQIDVVLNGYELTASRAGRMSWTRPYYVYELVLLARRDDGRFRQWSDLRGPAGRRLKVGVLMPSAACDYLNQHFAGDLEIIGYEGNTDAMREVETGKLDVTVADLPIAIFYGDRFAGLRRVGDPVGSGYYVAYVRQTDTRLRDALDAALAKLISGGQLKEIYERYGMWSKPQQELTRLTAESALGTRATRLAGWDVIASRGGLLLRSAGMTILLACTAMPLAIAIGLLVAIARQYGPAPVRWLSVAYVEVLRGTPLMLQLFVIFFMLPEIGLRLPALYAAIAGLAINYSAYESEIYRAGLLAVPRGQWEAALSLGMSPALTLRRIIVPQAMRLVVPPMTNDFIALFKDTSVCSVITVVELTKQYSVQRNDTGATLELAAMTALLYLLMSIPLAHLASRLERRLRAGERKSR